MKFLNRVQSKVYEIVLFMFENFFLCVLIGVGKINVVMFIILYEFGLRKQLDGIFDFSLFKIVYVVFMKVFVVEMVGNFFECLELYGVIVRELIGDVIFL